MSATVELTKLELITLMCALSAWESEGEFCFGNHCPHSDERGGHDTVDDIRPLVAKLRAAEERE